MPAFIIVETDIHDPDQYERYKEATPAVVAAAGGRFVVRGGDIAVLEGDWNPPRLVVLEFENLDRQAVLTLSAIPGGQAPS